MFCAINVKKKIKKKVQQNENESISKRAYSTGIVYPKIKDIYNYITSVVA